MSSTIRDFLTKNQKQFWRVQTTHGDRVELFHLIPEIDEVADGFIPIGNFKYRFSKLFSQYFAENQVSSCHMECHACVYMYNLDSFGFKFEKLPGPKYKVSKWNVHQVARRIVQMLQKSRKPRSDYPDKKQIKKNNEYGPAVREMICSVHNITLRVSAATSISTEFPNYEEPIYENSDEEDFSQCGLIEFPGIKTNFLL